MPSGTAVRASATLCTVSPSSATEPDHTTTTRLSERRDTEDAQRDPQGSHPLPGRLHGGIDRVRRLVGMRLDHVLDVVTETAQSTRPAALPLVTGP